MSKPVARRRAALVTSVVVIGLVALAGCAGGPSAKSTWEPGAARGKTYSTLLVVGVSPHLSQRCAFERILARRLRNEHTLVAASCDAMQQKEPLTREAIEATVQELGIDAVIATLLVSRKVSEKEGGSRDTRGGAYYKATDVGWAYGRDGYYGAWGVPVIYADFTTTAPLATVNTSVKLSTRVFDASTAKHVYTVNTSLKNVISRDQGFLEITAAIADELRDDGLVPGE